MPQAENMYRNRYLNIHKVVKIAGELGECTATQISKHCNLSRQAILSILEDAKLFGFVTVREEPYRQHIRKLWKATDYGVHHAKHVTNIWAMNRPLQKVLL